MATTRTYSLRWAARWADPSGFGESCAKVPGPPDPSCMREPDPATPLASKKGTIDCEPMGDS